MKSGKMQSVMNHQFSQIPDVKMQRSKFNRSHGLKTTFDAGYLIPIFVDEALPGDTFNLKMSCFGRLATQLCPIMDNMYLDTFFFAVPIRLIWNNWQKFNGEQTDPGDSTDYTIPVIDHTVAPLSTTGFTVMSLYDYMGLPTEIVGIQNISALWTRAYNLIWNEWFRDENLLDSVVVDKDDGPDDPADYVLLKRCKRHDYFTSCLPWAQKGDSVELPLGDSAPVIGTDTDIWMHNSNADRSVNCANGDNKIYFSNSTTVSETMRFGKSATNEETGLEADLSAATASTINALRQAFQVQRLYERDARGGTRYVEILRSHFGVTSPDFRLQRPEYLGGGRTVVNVNPIAQTSKTDGTAYLGNLGAMATVSASGHGFNKSFTEHCVLIGMVCATADLTYQQGLNRMWSRSTRWDFYWPALANIGEQAVLNKEIYCKADGNDDLVFGYQERYAEYRYKPSLITGKFRSTYASAIDQWHLSQEFGALPVLDTAAFISEDPPIDRVIAASSEPHFIFDSFFDLVCIRPMPMYSVPGMIDHF